MSEAGGPPDELEALRAELAATRAALRRAELARVDAEERARELHVDLERCHARARELHAQSEGLLEGMQVLSESLHVDELLRGMLRVLGRLLEFDDAFVLVDAGDGMLAPVASTSPRLEGTRWRPASHFQRVLRGETLAIFDTAQVPEWQAQPAEAREGAVSALHVPIETGEHPAVLVGVHRARGFFTRPRVQQARRLAVLARQALHNAELVTQLERRVATRTAELQEQRDFAQHVVQCMVQGLGTLDRAGRYVYVNPAFARMLGVEAEELLGRTLADLAEPADRGRLPAPDDAGALAQVQAYELHLRRGGDAPLFALVTAAPRWRDGELVGALHVVTDMTEAERARRALREARDAAEAANRTKSAVLANMSHELRTPLNAIIGYAEILLEDDDDAPLGACKADLRSMRGAAGVLLDLIGNVLDMAKIEADRMEVDEAPVDVAALCEAVVQIVRPLAERNGNRLVLDSDCGMVAHTDPVKLRQVLLNLLSNACKFTREGAVELRCTVEQDEGGAWLVFAVRDTGIGMSSEQLHRLFRPFVQADAATARRYGGTGLGLALSKHFTEMLGGALSVQSAPGRGSTFCVRVPARGRPARRASQTAGMPSV